MMSSAAFPLPRVCHDLGELPCLAALGTHQHSAATVEGALRGLHLELGEYQRLFLDPAPALDAPTRRFVGALEISTPA
jgi:hypothetical protein